MKPMVIWQVVVLVALAHIILFAPPVAGVFASLLWFVQLMLLQDYL